MADIALYRKYRPQSFDNLMGQEAVQKTLLNAIKAGHLSHAYLFCGPRGTGKTSSARLVAKAINCISPEPTGESCNKCEYCTLMNEGRLMDLIEIDAASNRGIDEIRDLREKIKFAPNQAPHKVYIIDEVHMLTTPAFNALLKTLEEPPSHAYFILATTEAHKVPDTIISRCQRFDFHRIDDATLIERLEHIAKQEQIEAETEALELIARAAEGGMRNAISLFEQMINERKITYAHVSRVLGLSGERAVESLFEKLEEQDVKEAIKEIQSLHVEGHDLYQFNREFLHFLRDKLLASTGKKDTMVRYLRWIELFQNASKELRQTLIPQLPLDVAAIKACMTPEEAQKAGSGWLSGFLGSHKSTPAPIPESPKKETAPAKPKAEGLKTLPDESAQDPKVSAPGEWTLESLQEQLPRILENIATPSVRQSFKTGIVQRLEGAEIHMDFQSNFHLEKVNTTANKSEIEKAFESVLGRRAKFHFKLGDTRELVDATLDIFGGELIE